MSFKVTKPIYSSCVPCLSAYSPAAASFSTSSYPPRFSRMSSSSQVLRALPGKVPTPSALSFEDTRSPLNVTVKSFCILITAHPLGSSLSGSHCQLVQTRTSFGLYTHAHPQQSTWSPTLSRKKTKEEVLKPHKNSAVLTPP